MVLRGSGSWGMPWRAGRGRPPVRRTGTVYGGGRARSERVAGRSGRAGRQHAQLVAGGVREHPPRQLAPPGVELAAAQLADPAGDAVRRRRRPRGAGRGAGGSCRPPWAGARGRARAAGRDPRGGAGPPACSTPTGRQPDSSAQNAASRSGSALSRGSAATGPETAYSGRSSMTQNGLPSGSASTTHGTPPWPMSRWRAPSPRARSTTSAWRGPPARSRCRRGEGVTGSGTRCRHRSSAGPPSTEIRVSKASGSSVRVVPPRSASQKRPSVAGSRASRTRFSRSMAPFVPRVAARAIPRRQGIRATLVRPRNPTTPEQHEHPFPRRTACAPRRPWSSVPRRSVRWAR